LVLLSLLLFIMTTLLLSSGNYAFWGCPFTCIICWDNTVTRTVGSGALPTTAACSVDLCGIIISFKLI